MEKPLKYKDIKSTKDIRVSDKMSESVIGQDQALDLIKKAAKQRRNVLLIGSPGTGKSLLGQALAELIPKTNLVDILSLHNPSDDNQPVIKEIPQGEGKKICEKAKLESNSIFKRQSLLMLFFVILISLLPYYFWQKGEISDIIYASSMITGMIFIFGFVFFLNISKKLQPKYHTPKLLIDNSDLKRSPFLDATGSHSGALLGDCLHDPLQCLSSSNTIHYLHEIKFGQTRQLQIHKTKISEQVNNLLDIHKDGQITKGNYKATYLNKGELELLGEKNKQLENSGVLSVNKHINKHPHLIKITTQSGKKLIVTPEHKVAVKRFGKIIYKAAEKLTRFDKVITFDDLSY